MKSLFIVLNVVLFLGLACVAPVSAEVDRVPAINTAADMAVIVSETALAEAPVLQLAEIVVEVADGAFFLLTSGGGSDARRIFMGALIAEVKEQLRVSAISADYQLFSVVKVTAATADDVEPILQGFINGYVVGVYFLCGSAYSFAW